MTEGKTNEGWPLVRSAVEAMSRLECECCAKVVVDGFKDAILDSKNAHTSGHLDCHPGGSHSADLPKPSPAEMKEQPKARQSES